MEITYLAKKLNVEGGGSNFSLDLMARSLAKRGHNVRIVTIESDRNELPDSYPYTIVEQYETFRTGIGVIKTVKEVLTDYETVTDVFHLFNPTYMAGGGRYRNSGGETPVICRLNQYTPFCTNLSRIDGQCYKACTTRKKFQHDTNTTSKKMSRIPFYAFRTHLLPRLANEIDRFFALSPSVKEIYAEIGIQKDNIITVPNFSDPDFGPNEYNNESDIPSTIRFLYVGRLVEPKGIDVLIEATAKVAQRRERSDFVVDIVGGPNCEKFERLLSQHDIEKIVNFHGRVDHDVVHNFYQRSSAFIHPGRWPEPFGRTLLEALHYNCPIIVSDIGGPPWVAGDAGFTFSPEESSELAKIMRDVVTNPEILREKKTACSEQLKRFDPETVVSQIESEYQAAASS